MKLYFSPGACSLSPHIVLQEAGLAYDKERVDLKTKKTASGGDFLQVNPKGMVPTLVLDDGSALTEGPAIVQYLADKAPAAGLAPANGTIERTRLQEWLNYISTELHKGFSPLFNPAMPEDGKKVAKEALVKRLDWLNGEMAKRDWIAGTTFSVADAYAFTVLNWTKFVGLDLATWPNLAAFSKRVGARPKVQEALKAEGLIK
jgi:glutathione S-transferase